MFRFAQGIREFVNIKDNDCSDSQNPSISNYGQTLQSHDLMEKKPIVSPYRVKEVVGQYGTFAKAAIARWTVLGRYAGFLCTE